ncbi:putative transporter [[Pasteurella] mairii]|uniref:Putative transporter n=1 Tax=[Pasteurella] mairii TaxID=757 RepID=A0A379B5G9_9PAST|nr:putative transporter [[Pasteurella] mairii]
MNLSSIIHKNSSFNPLVIGTTLLLVVLLVFATLVFPNFTQQMLDWAKAAIFSHFSWFYILSFSIFLFFLIALSVSSLGNIKLGSNEEEPEFAFHSWLAMLFAAGMGWG